MNPFKMAKDFRYHAQVVKFRQMAANPAQVTKKVKFDISNFENAALFGLSVCSICSIKIFKLNKLYAWTLLA